MALVFAKKLPTLKEKMAAAIKANEEAQEAPIMGTVVSPIVESLPAVAAAAKVEEQNTVIDQGGDSSMPDAGVQQAYADVLPRINSLVALSGEALEKEMSILKKALIENPDACALMLPTDIGKMVEALRRITGQALTDAVAKPKGGKKQKAIALSAEQMEAAFNEL